MRALKALLTLSFIPAYPDLALLLLRVWTGGLMLLHGWPKLVSFGERAARFADPFGLGSMPSLVLVIASELLGSILVIVGLFTRTAAIAGIVTMATAFTYAHGSKLTGPGNGELPFLFLGAYVAILLAGPGRFSLDGRGRS